MPILVVAQHNNRELNVSTLPAVTAANAIGPDVEVLVAGDGCSAVVKSAAQIVGVAKVLTCESPEYVHRLSENLAPLIAEVAENYSHIVTTATTEGKDLFPRVAGLVDVAPISDVVGVADPETFVRPFYAGNVLGTVRSKDAIKVITVRGTAFEPATMNESNQAEIESIAPQGDTGLAEFVCESIVQSDRPELTSADVVISGGRGMANSENFKLLEEIADRLGAAIGASRAAVDAGFVPNEFQVGQTGKIVAPKLYIAVGISGAIQHLAGMKDSKVIVAINKDEEAPIFQIADYGIVGDLFEVLPEFSAELGK